MENATAHNPRFAIFASGKGSNAEVLLQAFKARSIPGQCSLLISNRARAGALAIAEKFSIQTRLIEHQAMTREAHEEHLLHTLHEFKIDHILLAGYMRVLTPSFFEHFKGGILNIHPSLLPDYKGMHAVKQQIADKVRVAGATVHLVTPLIDDGPIILQGSLDVRGDENAETLQRRIQREVEHAIYPRAVWLFIQRQPQGNRHRRQP